MDDIKDIYPPIDLPDYAWVWLIGGIVIVVILVYVYFYFKNKSEKMEPFVDTRTSSERALEKLEALYLKQYPLHGSFKIYFIELSGIIRHFLEEHYAINAPEMTTEEFLDHVKGLNVLQEAQKKILKEFLVCADMVKFAKFTSNVEEAHKSFELIQQLIKETQPHGI